MDASNRPPPRSWTKRKQATLALAEQRADTRDAWIERNRFFFEEDWRYLRFLIPERKRVLDLGCGTGALLDALRPSTGVGIDFSSGMVERARTRFPQHTFVQADVENLKDQVDLAGTFDAIVLSDTVGCLDDCISTFQGLHRYCEDQTRLVVVYHSRLWAAFAASYLRIASRHPAPPQNWLSTEDIANLLDLADFDVIKCEWRLLSPFRLFGLGRLINRFVAPLPLIRKLCLRTYVVARPRAKASLKSPPQDPSATVVVPCRNERGNIEDAVRRLPKFCSDIEIMFVEGGSSDGTWEEIQRVKEVYSHLDIKAFKQDGRGKGDAVRKGFAQARGQVLMILDADLTVPPEDLPKFYQALIAGKGEFINGSRLVYPMERQAMRSLNLLANYVFARLFTYLLNQRHTDTLCGTKVLMRRDYDAIVANRGYFGEFDPFGDFDLIFGASKLNLKTAEVPIRYAARAYGETQISRFRHGWLLLRMVVFAFMKLKAL
jgi:SAM-dependent methyltransferase